MQTELIKKQKEKIAIEVAVLEKLGVELRPMLRKDVSNCMNELKISLKDMINVEMKATMKKEMKEILKDYGGALMQGGAGGAAGAPVVPDSASNSAPPMPGGDAPGAGGAMPSLGGFGSSNAMGAAMKRKMKAMAAESTKAANETRKDSKGNTYVSVGADDAGEKTSKSAEQARDVMVLENTEGQNPIPQDTAVEAILNNDYFEYFMSSFIIFNNVLIGLRTDHMANHLGASTPWFYQACDILSFTVFSTELGMRILCYGTFFFTMDGKEWNYFDTAIVICQGLELCGTMFEDFLPTDAMTQGMVQGIRALRFLRIVRLVRVTKINSELSALFTMVMSSMKLFFGGLVLLSMTLYCFGVLFCQLYGENQAKHDSDDYDKILATEFGGVFVSMSTLFQCITGGIGWQEPMDRLSSVVGIGGPPVFSLFIAFATYAVTNSIAGVFVAQAINSTQDYYDEALMKLINSAVEKSAMSMTGEWNFGDFKKMSSLPEMGAVFKAVGVEGGDPGVLFNLLDEDGNGSITYIELVNCCLRLRGTAKALDLTIFAKHQYAMNKWVTAKLTAVTTDMGLVRKRLEAFPTAEEIEQAMLGDFSMEGIDEDGDGIVTAEEIEAFKKKQADKRAESRRESKGA